MTQRAVRITGASILGRGEAECWVAEGRIQPGRTAGRGEAGIELDARGLLLAPALVDIHGDAFERGIQPRPGVDMPIEMAVAETEAALLSAGIATEFHGVTLSWEPGLRCEEAFHAWLVALDQARPSLVVDHRVHLRFEAFNLDSLPAAIRAIEAGRIHLVSFNDHMASIQRKLADPLVAGKYAGRAGMSVAAMTQLADRLAARAGEVEAGRRTLADAALAAGLRLASHDDPDAASRAYYRNLGADLAEFPESVEAAKAARDADEPVIMGAPNVVRGGSHTGLIGAAEMVRRGLCSVLASDYHYPSMAAAAFRLAREGMTLEAAWDLVAANPARAAGLVDRGRLEVGLRADLTLWADWQGPSPRLIAVLVAGRIAHLTAEGAGRLGQQALALRQTVLA